MGFFLCVCVVCFITEWLLMLLQTLEFVWKKKRAVIILRFITPNFSKTGWQHWHKNSRGHFETSQTPVSPQAYAAFPEIFLLLILYRNDLFDKD